MSISETSYATVQAGMFEQVRIERDSNVELCAVNDGLRAELARTRKDALLQVEQVRSEYQGKLDAIQHLARSGSGGSTLAANSAMWSDAYRAVESLRGAWFDVLDRDRDAVQSKFDRLRRLVRHPRK